ncbi:hypothetical protein K438DRAFT_1050104 [Mycena galopus ATCC 62051]|nr:hypothetical protein K438DRAFT_1050104 [Mycena galopus ATCC 62051]
MDGLSGKSPDGKKKSQTDTENPEKTSEVERNLHYKAVAFRNARRMDDGSEQSRDRSRKKIKTTPNRVHRHEESREIPRSRVRAV